jgi:hypothetical protein
MVITVTPSLSFRVSEKTKLAKMFQEFAKRFDCCPADVVVTVWNEGEGYAQYTTADGDVTVGEACISVASHVKVLHRKDLEGRRCAHKLSLRKLSPGDYGVGPEDIRLAARWVG